jgi:hypothetical protein
MSAQPDTALHLNKLTMHRARIMDFPLLQTLLDDSAATLRVRYGIGPWGIATTIRQMERHMIITSWSSATWEYAWRRMQLPRPRHRGTTSRSLARRQVQGTCTTCACCHRFNDAASGCGQSSAPMHSHTASGIMRSGVTCMQKSVNRINLRTAPAMFGVATSSTPATCITCVNTC